MKNTTTYWKGNSRVNPKVSKKIERFGWKIIGTIIYIEPNFECIFAQKEKLHSLWDMNGNKIGEGKHNKLGKYWWIYKAINGE